MSYNRPKIPRGVARQLRQESGFGCARCGHPYLEYHHIVPWSEDQHYRPQDMVALCGNCHAAMIKISREDQYDIKNNPCNIERHLFEGLMVSSSKENILLMA